MSQMSLNRKAGEINERLVETVARQVWSAVMPIETGWRIIGQPKRRGNQLTARIVPLATVIGDLFCVGNNGRAVLVEVKSKKDRLNYGSFVKKRKGKPDRNQLDDLTAFASAPADYVPGIALVAWTGAHRIFWLEIGLLCEHLTGPRTGIGPTEAYQIDQDTRELAKNYMPGPLIIPEGAML